MKNPTIYCNPDNPMEISFSKKKGYVKVDAECYEGGLNAFKLPSEEAVKLMERVLDILVLDVYCIAFDRKRKLIAYTHKDYEEVYWQDFSKV
jgi:hypothetical protein